MHLPVGIVQEAFHIVPGPRGNQKFLVDQKFLVFPEKPKKSRETKKFLEPF